MRTFIITLKQVEFSQKMAEECRETAREVGYKPDIETFWGVYGREWRKHLPKTANTFSYRKGDTSTDPIACCFTSHYLLWEKCIEINEPILILEHDAKFDSNIPDDLDFDMCINFGAPSFRRYSACNFIEPKNGIQPLRDEIFFGHHGYAMKPEAAKIFCDDVKSGKRMVVRNDTFIHAKYYPWLQEYYPYPISTRLNNITTVNKGGNRIANFEAESPPDLEIWQWEFLDKHFPTVKEGNVRKFIKD